MRSKPIIRTQQHNTDLFLVHSTFPFSTPLPLLLKLVSQHLIYSLYYYFPFPYLSLHHLLYPGTGRPRPFIRADTHSAPTPSSNPKARMPTAHLLAHASGVAGPSSWHPVVTGDTAAPAYWWNWRLLVCAIWVLVSMSVASVLIWKYECTEYGSGEADDHTDDHDRRQQTTMSTTHHHPHHQPQTQRHQHQPQPQPPLQDAPAGVLYDDDCWRPCLKEIHPVWLLLFRLLAFVLLATLLTVYVCFQGPTTFYFYTQWTFTLVTIYFGLGTIISTYGCYKFLNKVSEDRLNRLDPERPTYMAPPPTDAATVATSGDSTTATPKRLIVYRQAHQKSGVLGYAFQVIYQTNAGAVMLTDVVFWLIIVPFLEIKDYNLNFFMVGMHSVNAIFLLGDAVLNSLRFPWFRISYFFLWTATYVLFQWILHACTTIWWPYPFLDLSSPYAPLWYLIIGLMHIPCYAIFVLILKMKHSLLSRWFPQSYRATQ